MWYCILLCHRERLPLLDPACPRTDYSLSARTLLAHSSVPLASRPICIARTGLGRWSSVCLLWLYGTTSSHCKDSMSWRTLHCLVSPLSLCGVAASTNPSLWSCWELSSPHRSVMIHLASLQTGRALPMVMTRVWLLQLLVILQSISWWAIIPKDYAGTWTSVWAWLLWWEVSHVHLPASN